MPRKTLFKPVKQLEVGKDPLWREIFIEQKEEGSSESDSDGEEEELIKMYRDACAAKGLKVHSKKLDEGTGNQRMQARSAKVELFDRTKVTN